MRQFIIGIAFFMVLTGCTKDFNLDPQAVKQLYVIEGRISSMSGPYYVRVTKSASLLPPSYHNGARDSAEPVKDALVIISDGAGVTDTLIPAPKMVQRWHHFPNGDSQFISRQESITIHDRGFYQTTKIKGHPGRTYELRVEIGDDIFHASAYMPPVTPLEHAAIRDTLVPPYDTSFPTPVAYFRDPPSEKNYYMLKVQEPSEYRYDNYFTTYGALMNTAYLDYSILDDKLLVSGVNAVTFYWTFQGQNGSVILYMWSPNNTYQMRLGSITKEAYDFFNIMAKQMTYDGNVYKPTPTSPPGNISGGAMGLFFASHISDILMSK
jgi:hypothetical protein